MSSIEQFRKRASEIKKMVTGNLRSANELDLYPELVQDLIAEIEKLEKKSPPPSDREGIQDWDGGESRYRAYKEEFGLDEEDDEE